MSHRAIAYRAVHEHHAEQKLSELAALLDMVALLAPDTILEIGGLRGGTVWAFAQVVPDARIVVVDNFFMDGRLEYAGRHILIQGDSHNPETLREVGAQCGAINLLFIDGDHSYAGVRQDFEMYAPLVPPGGLVALHDVCVEQPLAVRDAHDVVPFWHQLQGVYGDASEIYAEDEGCWGGIGIIPIPKDAEALHAAVCALGEPDAEECQPRVPCRCAACGDALGRTEDTLCVGCAGMT